MNNDKIQNKLIREHLWTAILERVPVGEDTYKFQDLGALESFRAFVYSKPIPDRRFAMSVNRDNLTILLRRIQ